MSHPERGNRCRFEENSGQDRAEECGTPNPVVRVVAAVQTRAVPEDSGDEDEVEERVQDGIHGPEHELALGLWRGATLEPSRSR